MATQLQIRRGTATQVAAFTGAEGEIVVNTTNDSVHVNDGSTQGGFELARIDGANWAVTNSISIGGSTTVAKGSDGASILTLSGAAAGRKLDFQSFTNSGAAGAGFDIDATSGQGAITLSITGTERLKVDPTGISVTGNAGIGTSTVTDFSGSVLQIHASSGSAARIKLTTATSGTATSDGGSITFDTSNNLSLLNRESSALTFGTSALERMRIDSSGNVGIGTSNATPSNGEGMCLGSGSTITRLDIRNSTTGDATGDGTSLQLNGNNFTIENREAGYVAFATSLTERMRIDQNGSVGIHTSSLGSSTKLTVAGRGLFTGGGTDPGDGSAAGMSIGYDTSNGFGFIQAIQTGVATKPLRIQPVGTDHIVMGAGGAFVGVGTTSPAQTFHVKTGSDGGGITIQRNSTTENTYAQLGFSPTTNDAGTPNISIRGYRGASFTSNYLTFVVGGSGAGLERARFDSSGNFLLGRTSRLTSQVESISSDTVVSVHGTLSQHQTNAGIMQYTSNLMILRSYGATAGTGEIAFRTGGGGNSADGETMRITSDFKVGIGTSTPQAPFAIRVGTSGTAASTIAPALDAGIFLEDNASPTGNFIVVKSHNPGNGLAVGGVRFACSPDGQNYNFAAIQGHTSTAGKVASLRFFTPLNNTAAATSLERMRLQDDDLIVGSTGVIRSSSQTGVSIESEGRVYMSRGSGTGGFSHLAFYNGNGLVGTVQSSGSATSYNTSSDERLKDNIVDAPSASDDIDSIQVRSFDWKADGSHQKYGMVAQELIAVAPQAVSQPEDPEEMMSVDYSKLVPMLVKEIQSLRARVAQLETEEAN